MEDERECIVERDAKPRRNFAAISAAKRRLDQALVLRFFDFGEQVQVLVVALGGRAFQVKLFEVHADPLVFEPDECERALLNVLKWIQENWGYERAVF